MNKIYRNFVLSGVLVGAVLYGCNAVDQAIPQTAEIPETAELSWDSAKLREIEQEWKSMWEAYEKTPEDVPGKFGKDKYAEIERMVERLLRKRLSDAELRKLVDSIGTAPDTAFVNVLVVFMVKAFADSGDRDALVKLLATRCPSRIYHNECIEFYLPLRGTRLKDPITVLGEAFSKCQAPEVRHDLAASIRRGFAGLGIRGKDDATFVANAMEWYEQRKDRLTVNPNYRRNEMLVPLESYEQNPKLYEEFPYQRELLFKEGPLRGGPPEPDVKPAPMASKSTPQTERVSADELQGTWEVLEITSDGKPVSNERFKGLQFVFRKDTLVWIGVDGMREEFQVRLGSSQQPLTIDLVSLPEAEANGKETTALFKELKEETTSGIYELKEDSLRLCLSPKGTWQRPSSFEAREGSGHSVISLRRVAK